MARTDFGGQALLEGVLMRGRKAVGVAFRHPDGSIVAASEPLNSILHRNRFARAPFFRGLVVLYETLVTGTKWLMRAGSVQASGSGQEMGRATIALTLLITIGLAIGLFVLAPLFLAGFTTRVALGGDQALAQHLFEGAIRVAIFVGYLLLVSRSAEIRRVFRYHGAEHMTIHALENEQPLDIEHVRQYPTAHPRCGTEFLVVFIILSILLFSPARRSKPVGQHHRPNLAHSGHRLNRVRDPALRRTPSAPVVDPLAVPAGHLAAAHHDAAARRFDDRSGHRLDARGAQGQQRRSTSGQPRSGAATDPVQGRCSRGPGT
jgi:hypothetical protein